MTNRGNLINGDAGRGAADQALRAAQRVQRLRDQLAEAERQEQAWSAGSVGERRLAEVLRTAQWPTLHDQPWPGRLRANIDHLAIAPDCVWVIDAKNWTGEVLVSGGTLRQNGRSRRSQVEGAVAAATAVKASLEPGAPEVSSVICLTESGSDLPPTQVQGVLVVGLQNLTTMLGPAPGLDDNTPAQIIRVARALQRGPVAVPLSEGATTHSDSLSSPAGAYLRSWQDHRIEQVAHAAAPELRPRERKATARRGSARAGSARLTPLVGAVLLIILMFVFVQNFAAVTEFLGGVIEPWIEGFFDGPTTTG